VCFGALALSQVTGVLADTGTVIYGEKHGAVAICVGIWCDAISGISKLPGQAARSIG
jgi:hypothetical protein